MSELWGLLPIVIFGVYAAYMAGRAGGEAHADREQRRLDLEARVARLERRL